MALALRRNHGRPRADEGPAPSRWDPLDELERLRQLEPWRHVADVLGHGFTPLADVEETPTAYVVEIEVPGVEREDVDIEIGGSRLTVRGERKEKQRAGILRRRERTVGRFTYEVTVPGDVDDAAVTADLTEGVLTVTLPKPERDRPRRIEIR